FPYTTLFRSRSRFGVLLSEERVLDVSALGEGLPASVLECIEQGESALAALRAAVHEAEASSAAENARTVVPLAHVTLEAPYRPAKIMAVGKNYADHVAEASGSGYTRVAGFVKLSSCIAAPNANVIKPRWTESFDYENELAVVIGRACCDVAPEAAYDYV